MRTRESAKADLVPSLPRIHSPTGAGLCRLLIQRLVVGREQVAHLVALGAQVVGVVRVGLDAQRHLLGHRQAVSVDPDDLLGVVGERCGSSTGPGPAGSARRCRSRAGRRKPSFSLASTVSIPSSCRCRRGACCTSPMPRPSCRRYTMHAAPLVADLPHARRRAARRSRSAASAEHVAGQAFAVHAHQHRLQPAPRRPSPSPRARAGPRRCGRR